MPPRNDSSEEAVDFELVGTLIGGKYRVRDVLGHGGMGTVFEALREGLGNTVAIKVLHPNQLQKKDAVQRFHQEARAAARIGHPNICEVYDVGTLEDGRPYLVMDRLTGVTLADRIQSLGGLPFQEVLDTLTQVLSGLHAAHEKGIIHRDVKPENVFLSQRVGCPPLAKILDFGVSKVMSQSGGGEWLFGGRSDTHRRRPRHALLPRSRTSSRRALSRRAGRPLRVWGDAVRGSHGTATLSRPELQCAPHCHPDGHPAAGPRDSP